MIRKKFILYSYILHIDKKIGSFHSRAPWCHATDTGSTLGIIWVGRGAHAPRTLGVSSTVTVTNKGAVLVGGAWLQRPKRIRQARGSTTSASPEAASQRWLGYPPLGEYSGGSEVPHHGKRMWHQVFTGSHVSLDPRSRTWQE